MHSEIQNMIKLISNDSIKSADPIFNQLMQTKLELFKDNRRISIAKDMFDQKDDE